MRLLPLAHHPLHGRGQERHHCSPFGKMGRGVMAGGSISLIFPSFFSWKMLQVARKRERGEREHPLTLLLCQYPKLVKTYKIRPKDENKCENPSSFALHLISLSSSEDSSLGIDLLVVWRIWRGEGHPLGLIQGIGALVLLPHAVHDEHDEQDGAEEANHSTTNKCCKGEGHISYMLKD